MTRPVVALTLLLTALSAIGQLSISMYAPSMPAIGVALGTTPGMVQVTLSVFLLTFALAQLVYGPLSDRFGRRRSLLVGLVLFVAGSLACALAPTIETLIAGRVLQAAGACAGASVSRAVVRDLFEREEAVRVMAAMTMAFTVAPAVGPILGGYLQAAFDWHAVFAVLAILGAALLATANARLPETNRHRDPLATRPGRMASTYAGLLANPAFLAYVVPSTAMIGGMLTMHASLPFLLIGSLGVSPTAYGWLTLITVAAFFSGSFVTGRFGPRIGSERTIRISLVLLGLSGALYLGSALLVPLSIASVLTPMVAWVFALGLAIPALMASAMAPFARTAGSASALMGCLQMAGGAVGSVLIAKVQDGTLLPLALLMALLAAVAGLGYRRFRALAPA
jgi:DHA1 family bicyclomycin/chloramphenicol resistance-like MFS transporter